MLGMSWENIVVVTFVTAVLFVYAWLRSHGAMHTGHPHVDSMAGDEGED